MKLLAILIIALFALSAQAKDKKPKKTWNNVVADCQVKILSNQKANTTYTTDSLQVINTNCVGDFITKTSDCKKFFGDYANATDKAAAVPEKDLSAWRSCYKKCKGLKPVKKDSNATTIAQDLIDCSSNVLALSLMIVGVTIALLF